MNRSTEEYALKYEQQAKEAGLDPREGRLKIRLIDFIQSSGRFSHMNSLLFAESLLEKNSSYLIINELKFIIEEFENNK